MAAPRQTTVTETAATGAAIGERARGPAVRTAGWLAATPRSVVEARLASLAGDLFLNVADLVVPDGMPLVWLARLRGLPLERRVYGPELMPAFCEQAIARQYRHFFYGGAPGVAEELARRLTRRFPGLVVAGTYCPPYRPLAAEEEEELAAMIRQARPDVLWVGLSTHKQERWMNDHRARLQVPVMVGVGAAFDTNAGIKEQAPGWMREHGFEWLYRLLQEPRRLWRRYLLAGASIRLVVHTRAVAAEAT